MVLGGFSQVLPSTKNLPGWIVRIESEWKHVWFVAVYPNAEQHIFKARIINEPLWEHYIGSTGRVAHSIYDGDDPVASTEKHHATVK